MSRVTILCHSKEKLGFYIYIYMKKNLINIQMKNCSITNFTNKMETYLDFNQKYKTPKSHTYIIN
jgi:hypothetical protein